MIIETSSRDETVALGEKIAKSAKSGEIYTLSGDLGVGKTQFSQGFAKGLGIEGEVTSPTFTIICEYEEGRLPLYHFDMYRLEDSSELEAIGGEEYLYGEGICLIEWPEMVADILPNGVKAIKISKDISKGVDYRRIELDFEI